MTPFYRQWILIFSVGLHSFLQAQNVGIGTNSPDPSAKLHINDSNRGILIPRLSLTNVIIAAPVTSPATGLLVFNNNPSITGGNGTGFYYWSGTQWKPLEGGNTLDMAYDQGGAGVGRTINADAGPVEINGNGGLWINASNPAQNSGIQVNNSSGSLSSEVEIGYINTSGGNNNLQGIRSINDYAVPAINAFDGSFGVFGTTRHPTGGTINLNTTANSINKAIGVAGSLGSSTDFSGSAGDMIAAVAGITGNHNSGGGAVTGARLYAGLFSGNGRTLGLWGENSTYIELIPRRQSKDYKTAVIGFYNAAANGANNGSNIGTGDSYLSIESNITDATSKDVVLQARSNGNVGVGTSTPSEKLHVNGNARISGLSGVGNRIVKTDANGVLTAVATTGAAGEVLTSDGLGTYSWQSPLGQAWNINGNTGTVASNNFIGTTDNQVLNFRTNNLLRASITTKGQLEVFNTGESVFIGQNAGQNDDLSLNRNVFLGFASGQNNTTGFQNTAVGFRSLNANTIGQNNASFGNAALLNNMTGSFNVGIGSNALLMNSSGSYNAAIGVEALQSNTVGIKNQAFGYQALQTNVSGNSNNAFGYQGLKSNSTGTANNAFGDEAMASNTTGNFNSVLGHNALYSNDNGVYNTGVGANVLYSNVSGNYNNAIGAAAMYDNVSGNNNCAIGYESLANNIIGSNNTAIGYFSLFNSNAFNNSAIGYQALSANTFGANNNAIGSEALRFNTGGYSNNAIGYQALYLNTTGSYNAGIGQQSLYANSTGNNNIAIGFQALRNNTTGQDNNATGFQALFNNTTGNSNSALGAQALYNNSTGFYNAALGAQSLRSNSTGQRNSSVGYQSLYNNTSGNFNTALGNNTLYGNTSGLRNTAVGSYALRLSTTGNNNNATGYQSMMYNATGNNNNAAGYQTLFYNTTGNSNNVAGYQAMYSNVGGSNNTALGYRALYANTNGFSNTALGYSAFLNGTTFSNSMALGFNAAISASNQIRLGNSAVSSIGGFANWTNVSDGRFKTNVKETVVGLDFINLLRPVCYNLDMQAIAATLNTPDSLRTLEAESLKGTLHQSGFIAQEVANAALLSGYDFSGIDLPRGQNGHYGLRYAEFTIPLVKAVQELSAENEVLKKRVEQLEQLQNEVSAIKKKLSMDN